MAANTVVAEDLWMPKRNDLILQLVAEDKTFKKVDMRGTISWCGKCIHCKTHIHVSLSGKCMGKTTIEHILPKHHGGTDDPANLSLACKRCNNQKGVRLDARSLNHPKLQEVMKTLFERKEKRQPKNKS